MNDRKTVSRNLTYARVYNYALEMFDFDKDKTNHWWMNKCEEFGDLSPFEMVKMGKGRKLVKLIQRCR